MSINKYILKIFFIAIVSLVAAGCAANRELNVKEPWARPGTVGGNSAVYFTIDNPAGQPDTLLAAEGDIAGQVEIHRSTTSADGVMMMQEQADVPVPARSTVAFAPGGLHIMLVGLTQDLGGGDMFTLRLRFAEAGEISVIVPVEDR